MVHETMGSRSGERLRRASIAGIALAVALSSLSSLSSASATTPAQAGGTPLVAPGGGALMSDPLVIGSDAGGRGALQMIDGAITNRVSNFDDTPPELSLRAVTLVRDSHTGGYSAVLRYRVPIVQLHSWRGVAVRMTQTIILRSPAGDSMAVQIQADGTTAVGSWDGQTFTPTGAGDGVLIGNVAVISVPPGLGVTPEWTVQALVEVVADGQFRDSSPATGFAAGSSIVPVGYLTGESDPTATVSLIDARTTLAAPAGAPDPSTIPDGVRVTAVRFEGTGTDRVLAIDTAGNPRDVPLTAGGYISASFSLDGFSALDPTNLAYMSWFPNQTDDVHISFPDGSSEQVPTTVTETGLRLALGEAVRTPPPVGGKQLSQPPMNELVGSSVVRLGTDESVSSIDGISAADPAPHAPASVTVAIDRGAVTVTDADGTVVSGFVDAEGYFVAYNNTENYTGIIDQIGNVVVYRTVVSDSGTGASGFRASPRPNTVGVEVDGDYTIFDLPGQDRVIVTTSALSFLKNHGPPPELPEGAIDTGYSFFIPLLPPLAFAATSGEPAQPAGAQAGGPDWPLLPLTNKAPTSESDVQVQVRSGMNTDTGQNELLSPWLDAAAITRAPTVPAVATTTTGSATNTASTIVAPVSSLPAITTIASASNSPSAASPPSTPGTVPTAVSAGSSGSDSSSARLVIVLIVVVSSAAGVWFAARRKRRPVPPPAGASAPRVRGVQGPSTHRVSHPTASVGLGVRIASGPPTHTTRHTGPDTEQDST